jgi:hypothetical protein
MVTREQAESFYPEGTVFVNGAMDAREGYLGFVVDTPSDLYPHGSECPLHERQHNSHGWYVCLTMAQAYDAFGPFALVNDGEFVDRF